MNSELPILTEEERSQKRRKEKRRERSEKKDRRQKHKERKKAQMSKSTTMATASWAEEGKRLRDSYSNLGLIPGGGAMGDFNHLSIGGDDTTSEPIQTYTCLCNNCLGGQDTCITDDRCVVITKLENGYPHTVYGCIGNANIMELAYCEGGNPSKSDTSWISASCCKGDMCNDVPAPILASPKPTQPIQSMTESRDSSSGVNLFLNIHPAAFLAVPAVLCILLVMLIVYFFWKKMKTSQKKKREKERIRNYLGDNLSAQPLTEDSSIELPDPTSGSGSGLPMLVPRSVAKNIDLEVTIGTGKYGNVYKGEYHGSPVAVKIFLSKDVASWECENEIYTTLLLRHENILGFIASDMISCDSVTQFWLICHYHENGSLYDFLNQNVITASQCLLMLHSAASGLVHLHTEISGLKGKPAIAHRDIKSKNILVKDDGSCCIADLGLSVVQKYDGTSFMDRPRNQQVGTKRYMAPEVLSEKMNTQNFESYKQADVYSFSLVMWETAICAIIDGHAEKYHMPYGGLVPSDPTFDEMKRLVVTDRRRPHLPTEWKTHKLFRALSKMTQECWTDVPTARLSMLRVKKNLYTLLEDVRDYKEYV